MSQIRLRRSGLASFAIKMGSTLTGLAFVVIVTSNLSISAFGLWQLISKTIAYVLFAGNVLYFWTLRYRARGTILGRTVIVGGLIFSGVLTLVYIMGAFLISGAVSPVSGPENNQFYFFLSIPAIALYVMESVITSILWGSNPERASYGFGVFEIAKVVLALFTVSFLNLSLAGAIIAVMGGQGVQLIAILFFTRKEYSDRVNFSVLKKMIRTGWLALLNSLQPLVINFDYLVVALLTSSTVPLALYGGAAVFANVITYSSVLASGLYAGILAGRDPRDATKQVLELVYIFLFPMTIGIIILSHDLLNLLSSTSSNYAAAVPILTILAIGSAFSSLSMMFDNVISGTDTTDTTDKTSFSVYSKSKLFLLSKINIGLAITYLVSIGIIAYLTNNFALKFLDLPSFEQLGIFWAVAVLSMNVVAVIVKLAYVRQVASLSVPSRTVFAILIATLGYSVVLFLLSGVIHPHGGKLLQAAYILVKGVISLGVYGAILYGISDSVRRLLRAAISSFLETRI